MAAASEGADPDAVGERPAGAAYPSSAPGAGNHFRRSSAWTGSLTRRRPPSVSKLRPGGADDHTGSRGFGYQVCDDALGRCSARRAATALTLPDRQLACAG